MVKSKKSIIVSTIIIAILTSVIGIVCCGTSVFSTSSSETSSLETSSLETSSLETSALNPQEFPSVYSESEYDPNEPMTWYAEAQNGGIEDDAIDKIKDGMTLDEVISILGRPQRDVGYGMMIMEWDMKPGKVFTVWFTPEPYPTPCEPNGIYHGNSLDWVTSDMEVLDKSGD